MKPAILGGRPALAQAVHVTRPFVPPLETVLPEFEKILSSGWLTNDGPYVRRLEGELARLFGVEHCSALANGTLALQLVYRALRLTGEAITTPFTFCATAHSISWEGIEPVFCDIDPETYCIAPARVEAAITPRTSAIVAVHVYGNPCDVDALTAIAERHGLALIFDAAHAVGASYRGSRIGGFGAAETFSFHATKLFSTFEGGCVTTNDDELNRRLALLRNFGFTGIDQVSDCGINAKLNEISAAYGLAQLPFLDEILRHRQGLAAAYRSGLSDLDGVHFQTPTDGAQPNDQYMPIRIDESEAGLSRDVLYAALQAENVSARRYFYPPCNRFEHYRDLPSAAAENLAVAERVSSEILCLPMGSDMDAAMAERICDAIRRICQHADDVAKAVASR